MLQKSSSISCFKTEFADVLLPSCGAGSVAVSIEIMNDNHGSAKMTLDER
jgi:hypothetical protein